MILLEHQAQGFAAQMIPLAVVEVAGALIINHDLAAVGLVESGREVQQGALATTALAEQRCCLARGQVQICLAQHLDIAIGLVIGLADCREGEHAGTLTEPREKRHLLVRRRAERAISQPESKPETE